MVLVQVQYFGTGTRYDLEILYKYGKRLKTKSQKVLWAKFYVYRSYRGKTGSPSTPPPQKKIVCEITSK